MKLATCAILVALAACGNDDKATPSTGSGSAVTASGSAASGSAASGSGSAAPASGSGSGTGSASGSGSGSAIDLPTAVDFEPAAKAKIDAKNVGKQLDVLEKQLGK